MRQQINLLNIKYNYMNVLEQIIIQQIIFCNNNKLIMNSELFTKNFRILREIYKQQFGRGLIVSSILNDQLFVIKCEDSENHPQPLIAYQTKILNHLNCKNNPIGIPQVFYSGVRHYETYIVTNYLDFSLERLFDLCQKQFDLKTVLNIGLQLLDRIQYIHSKNIIHRDINPNNIFISSISSKNQLFLTDFRKAKFFIDKNGKHIPYRDNKQLIASIKFASLNNHVRIQPSRRDDIQSLAYILIYLLRGNVPWQNIKGQSYEDRSQLVFDKKIFITEEILCKGIPIQFSLFLKESKRLYFDQIPDYKLFKNLLMKVLQEQQIELSNDFIWNQKIALILKLEKQKNKFKEVFKSW